MIVWVDLETTGLDPAKETPLELGYIFTDDYLNEIKRGSTVIHCDESVRGNCHDIVQKMHDKSGLWQECFASDNTAEWVDAGFAKGLAKLKEENGESSPLAGSSVHFDRKFMEKYFPKSLSLLHYRNIDVSSWKEVIKRTHPELEFNKDASPNIKPHRALQDLDNSIAELKHYLSFFGVKNV